MNELLNLAVKAHDGLERWNKVKSVKVAEANYGGDLVCEEQGRRFERYCHDH